MRRFSSPRPNIFGNEVLSFLLDDSFGQIREFSQIFGRLEIPWLQAAFFKKFPVIWNVRITVLYEDLEFFFLISKQLSAIPMLALLKQVQSIPKSFAIAQSRGYSNTLEQHPKTICYHHHHHHYHHHR